MVDANDAPGIQCPFLMIPSEGEDQGDVEKWEKAVKVKHEVVWYKDQGKHVLHQRWRNAYKSTVHGFMAARSDLEDEKVAKAYKSAYEKVLTFFHDNLA